MPKLPKCKLAKPKIDMMLQLQIKFVAVAMSILIAVFLIMLSSINMMMRTVSQHQSMQLLRQIALSDRYNSVEIPEDLPPEPPQDQPHPMAETAAGRSAVITVQQLANRNWWEQEDATGWWENEDWENNGDNHWETQTTKATKPAAASHAPESRTGADASDPRAACGDDHTAPTHDRRAAHDGSRHGNHHNTAAPDYGGGTPCTGNRTAAGGLSGRSR